MGHKTNTVQNIDKNKLNEQFINIPVPILQNKPSNFSQTQNLGFAFAGVSQMDVAQSINKIKSKVTGVDDLNPTFLKTILHIVLPYITHIFNTVLTTSVFPDIWQKSKVIPIPKTQNEYRLISILPFLSK